MDKGVLCILEQEEIPMASQHLSSFFAVLWRFKLHHVLFWAVYHLAWWSLYAGSLVEVLGYFDEAHGVVKYLGYVVYQAVGVYFCLYVLIPKFLQKGKYFLFFTSVIGVVLFMSVGITFNYYLASLLTDKTVYELFNVFPESPVTLFKHNALPSCVGAITLGMSIKLTKIWIDSQKRQKALEKEKLETELKFLKSQFNPHFLFNTINSIFVLIDKNPEMASESLVKFSNLLRYQLYECNANQIPLKNELAYIKSLLELESLRQNENFDLQIDWPDTISEEYSIAPFILIPFIENSFKHISEDRKLKKWIRLRIQIKEGSLIFHLANSANFELRHELPEGVSYGGLGLKNVKRRLAIIYPESHNLVVSKEEDSYVVHLDLKLRKEEMVHLKKVVG